MWTNWTKFKNTKNQTIDFISVKYAEQGMAKWRERSSFTSVAQVRFQQGAICGLILLLVLALFFLFRVFLQVLRFSSLHKKQNLQIPIQPG